MATLMLSLKTALISTGVISVAILLKVSAPSVTEFVTSGIPSIYGLILPFLRPPYLYLLINGIIISIVASSKLQAQKPESTQQINPSPEIVSPALKVPSEEFSNEYSYGTPAATFLVAEESKRMVEEEQVKVVMEAAAAAAPAPLRTESMELISLMAEKPPLARRFGQRKAVKAATEGKTTKTSRMRFQNETIMNIREKPK